MRFLPFERLTLRSESPPEVVEAKLAALVATAWFSLTPPPEPFRGSVRGRHFKVVRVLGTIVGLPTRNAWQPLIVGDIAPAAGGTEVRVRMRLRANMAAGTFFLTPVVARPDGTKHDVRFDAVMIEVAAVAGLYSDTLVNLEPGFEIERVRTTPTAAAVAG